MPSSTVTATMEAFGRSFAIFVRIYRRLRLSFPPETATAILSLKLNIPCLAIVARTFFSTASVKHFLQRRCPEYGLKKKGSRRWHPVHFSIVFLIGFTYVHIP